MKIIHVLGDEKFELFQVLEFHNGKMADVGLYRIPGSRQGSWRQALVSTGPDAVRASKIGESRFRAYPGPGEKDRITALVQPCGELLNPLAQILALSSRWHIDQKAEGISLTGICCIAG